MTTTARPQSEAAFQKAVIELAERCGWKAAHFSDSRREVIDRRTRHRLLVGDKQAAGFPDLVLIRDEVLIFAELKTETGRASDEQETWLWLLSALEAPSNRHVQTYLWKPSNWPSIERLLTWPREKGIPL